MKILIILISCIYFLGCEDKAGTAKVIASIPKPETVFVGQTSLIDMEDGDYVLPMGAHPTLYGDIIEIDNGTYKKAHWVSGQVVIETGSIEFEQTVDIKINGADEADVHTYINKVMFIPNTYSPSNCGYSFDSYVDIYIYESNGPTITQHVDLGETRWTQSVDWPLDVDYAQANLTATCL